jgi:TolB protein
MVSHDPRRPIVLGIALALVAAATVAPSAMATFPGRNGPITFERRDADGFTQIWTARSDLTHERQLTAVPMRDSDQPMWSPDESRIAFDSDRADPDLSDDVVINDIFTMRSDGSGLRKLTNSIGLNGAPAYSPDGKLIAFEGNVLDVPSRAGIFVMNAADGSHVRRVTTVPADGLGDSSPRFSPDGKRLVFTRFRDGFTKPNGDVVEWGSALHTVKLDGSGLRRITPWELRAGTVADWSPDGTKLVFEVADVTDGRQDAWMVGSDGRGLRNLTKASAVPGSVFEGFADPVWSPDGRLILLVYIHFSTDPIEVFTEGLATIRPNGTDLHYPGGEGNSGHHPDWGRAERH